MTNQTIRVCSFESRRREEMRKLIEKFGGAATVAPSMQEVSLEEQPDVVEFYDKLMAGEIDLIIFLTGVGTDSLFKALKNRIAEEELAERIGKTQIVARGPKPAISLRKKGLKPDVRAPEPNTWQDMVQEMENQNVELANKVVAIQEYGAPSLELYQWLESKGAKPLPVSIYRWELPDDIYPLQSAIEQSIAGQIDLFLWTSAQQVVHVLEVAAQMGVQEDWMKAAAKAVHASIGPIASAKMRERGIEPAMEPSHPKMAHLVREAIRFASK